MRKLIFIALLGICALVKGQGIKISALPNAGSLSGSEYVPVVQGLVTKKTTTQAIANLGGGGGWSLTGNSGTNPANDSLGTTDGADLKIHSTGGINIIGDADNFEITNYGGNPININSLSGGGINLVNNNGSNIGISGTGITFIADQNIFDNISHNSLIQLFGKIQIVDSTQGAGKVLTSDANGLASWQATSFTTSDSATIYALTPTDGTTYFCSDCSGSGVTGRIVSYFGGLWRRLKFD